MAINVDNVYQTVLLILNKKQRGYMTPDEFNKTATQVQLEIFKKYFEDLNQSSRVPQNDMDYANRTDGIDEKMSLFRRTKTVNRDTDIGSDVYRLGTVSYQIGALDTQELERVTRSELYHLNSSKLTKPSTTYPVYIYENKR